MILTIFYLFALILELSFFILFSIITISLIYSSLKGSPYVPTKNIDLAVNLKTAQLKKNQIFMDLGCGDGRVVREAVKKYQVKGIGYDVNFLLIFWAKFLAKIQKLSSLEFKQYDIVKNSLPKSDVIYIFLMPNLINKISDKLYMQLQKGVLIISHGFKINRLSKFLIKKINHKQFTTYFYKIISSV